MSDRWPILNSDSKSAANPPSHNCSAEKVLFQVQRPDCSNLCKELGYAKTHGAYVLYIMYNDTKQATTHPQANRFLECCWLNPLSFGSSLVRSQCISLCPLHLYGRDGMGTKEKDWRWHLSQNGTSGHPPPICKTCHAENSCVIFFYDTKQATTHPQANRFLECCWLNPLSFGSSLVRSQCISLCPLHLSA